MKNLLNHIQTSGELNKYWSAVDKLNDEGTIKKYGIPFRPEEMESKFNEIEAGYVTIMGKLEGNIIATRKVIMMPPAIFRGTVTTPSLKIEEGVVFEGASYVPKT